MVIIRNISNKPVGVIGGQVCLPNEKIEFKDKEVLCDVFDEEDRKTGEKQILPGLKAMEQRGFITIDVVKEAVEEKVTEDVEEAPVKKATKAKKKKSEE